MKKFNMLVVCALLSACTNTQREPVARVGGSLHNIVGKAAVKHGVPVKTALAVTKVESGFNCKARSSAGALGAMQVMPATARGLGYTGTNSGLLKCDVGVEYGMRALKQCHTLGGGNLARIGACYNAGPGSLKWKSLPRETVNYIAKLKRAI